MPRPTLLGIPWDASSSFLRGAAGAPLAIREALHSPSTNSWSELGVDIGPALADAGDAPIAGDEYPLDAIADAVAAVVDDNGLPIVLGGDHSITYAAIRGLRRTQPPFAVLHIDAHPDLYDSFDGNRFSHACPFARVMEEGLVEGLVQVGIRGMNGHQRDQARWFGVEVIDMPRWDRGDRPSIGLPVYLSIDIDGLDPAFAPPGVSHPEPGGLSVRDVIGLIHAIAVPVVGADVVEYNPTKDLGGATARVAAKLVKEVVGLCLRPPTSRYA